MCFDTYWVEGAEMRETVVVGMVDVVFMTVTCLRLMIYRARKEQVTMN